MCNLYLQDRRHDGTTPRWRGVTLLHEMKARGIPVAVASDNTRDPFYAYGDLDMLEVYRMATRILHFDHPVGDWPQAVAATPADIMRLQGAGTLVPGGSGRFRGVPRAQLDGVAVAAGIGADRGARRQGDRTGHSRLCRTRRPDGVIGWILTALKRELDGIKVEDHPAIVQQKSRDFYWYSPVLKRELDHVKGDAIVSPKSEAEVIRVLAACHRHGMPVTPRGSGTGNYGQAMPLSGGVVLSLADMNEVTSIGPGRVVTGPGAVLAEIDRATRAHSGQELRMSPSTYNTASIGGFVAGGSGGVGSIRWGGLRDLGNVIRLRIVTMQAEPQVMELTGEDMLKVMHAYGTNGIITEVEMPLTASYDWIDVIVGFDDFMDAARFGNDLGMPGRHPGQADHADRRAHPLRLFQAAPEILAARAERRGCA